MDKTQLFRLIEKHSAKIEESSKNGIIAHHVEVDDLVDDLFALCEVSHRRELLKAYEEANNPCDCDGCKESTNDKIEKYLSL